MTHLVANKGSCPLIYPFFTFVNTFRSSLLPQFPLPPHTFHSDFLDHLVYFHVWSGGAAVLPTSSDQVISCRNHSHFTAAASHSSRNSLPRRKWVIYHRLRQRALSFPQVMSKWRQRPCEAPAPPTGKKKCRVPGVGCRRYYLCVSIVMLATPSGRQVQDVNTTSSSRPVS